LNNKNVSTQDQSIQHTKTTSLAEQLTSVPHNGVPLL